MSTDGNTGDYMPEPEPHPDDDGLRCPDCGEPLWLASCPRCEDADCLEACAETPEAIEAELEQLRAELAEERVKRWQAEGRIKSEQERRQRLINHVHSQCAAALLSGDHESCVRVLALSGDIDKRLQRAS